MQMQCCATRSTTQKIISPRYARRQIFYKRAQFRLQNKTLLKGVYYSSLVLRPS